MPSPSTRLNTVMTHTVSLDQPTLPLQPALAPAVPDHPRIPRLWVGGQGFDVADGESGSAAETGIVERERGREDESMGRQADWQAKTSRLPGHLP